MSKYFEGLYYKHQKGDDILAVIPGRSEDQAFVQVITNQRSYNVPYELKAYQKSDCLIVGSNRFSKEKINLDIHTKDLSLTGELWYKNLSPIAYDIMGPFRCLPMECRHSVLSMNHDITGKVTLNGKSIDFSNGRGYLEGDKGRSFPSQYTWLQCNDFDEDCSIMVSVAKIPFGGLKFWGCIGIVYLAGREYRFATYKGVRIINRSPERLELRQGKYRLIISLPKSSGYALYAPKNGAMCRVIKENPACEAVFTFYIQDQIVFSAASRHVSFEHVQ